MTWLKHLLMVMALALVVLTVGKPLRGGSEAQSPPSGPRGMAPCDGVSEIPRAECEALVALYQSTDGPHWLNRSGWLENATPCSSWYGVTCSAGHVQVLELRDNDLRGTLPTTLDALSALESLHLGDPGGNPHNNALSGPIPATLGNITTLRGIDFGRNALTGPIPHELSHLTNLVSLGLSFNQLSGPIPLEITSITGLEFLSLHGNQLTGTIPVSLSRLSSLRWLDLCMNQLTGTIPPELGNLSQLEHLSLCVNSLSGTIPPELGRLSRLRTLRIDGAGLIGGIPPELGNLSELETLNIGGQPLSGPIPPELGRLSKLQYLYLDSCGLSGAIPREFGNLRSLRHLYLSSNYLTGGLPAEMANLSALEALDVRGNQLSGPVPSWLGGLTNLQTLGLSTNRFSGPIPPELGNLTRLNYLGLAANALEGEIPSTFANLTSLRRTEHHEPPLYQPGLEYNMLYCSNPTVAAFWSSIDPYWAGTQTLPPTGVHVTGVYSQSVALAWSPIVYTADYGHYQVSVARSPSGPFIVHGDTLSKTDTTYLVTGLIPETTYYLRVRTFTYPHDYQQNALLSAPSQVVSVTLPVYETTACSCLAPGDALLPVELAAFRPYTGTTASSSPLIRIPSPPAPAGWQQPSYAPDTSWRLAEAVWWSAWESGDWRPSFPTCAPIGLRAGDGSPQGVSGTTHLMRHSFSVAAPPASMELVRAVLEMWSDNKSEWWWQGEVIATDREGNLGAVELYPGRVAPEGGSYLLAVQSSNDLSGSVNPQGTAARLCVTWRYDATPTPRGWLPLVAR